MKQTFLEQFFQQVRENPDQPALEDAINGTMSFRELAGWSGKVMHWLMKHGIGTEDFVVIHLPRTIYAVAAMLGAAADGTLDFVADVREYGRRAKITKDIFLRNGFHIIYDHDNEELIADGFFFTVGYGDMNNQEIITNLMRCGVATISLHTAYSEQSGVRVCVSALSSDEHFEILEQRLSMFNQYFKDRK